MKRLFMTACAALMILCMAGCGKANEVQVPVQSVAEIAGLGAVGLSQRFAGVVSVQDPVKVMKNADTKVGEIMVEEGDEVKEGDVLFVYDTDQLNLDLEKARLELEKLYNDIANMQKERESLEKEKAKAPADQQLQYSLEINGKDTEILEGNYNAQVKQKEIESLEKSLENATVKATASGRIGTITDGEKTDNMGNPEPLITIVQTNDLLIKGSVNENNIYALTPGMDVLIRSRIDDRTWHGVLSKIDMDNPVQNQDMYYMAYDSGDSTTNSSKYPFIVEIDDTEGLMLGQHVYVEPGSGDDQDTSSSWYLPAWYIVDIESNPFVWAQDHSGKLEKRSVSLGNHNEEMDSYVIDAGITLEDKIAFPDDSLKEGDVCVDYREYVPPADETPGDDGGIYNEGDVMPEMPEFEDGAMPEFQDGAVPEVDDDIMPEFQDGAAVDMENGVMPEIEENIEDQIAETIGGGN